MFRVKTVFIFLILARLRESPQCVLFQVNFAMVLYWKMFWRFPHSPANVLLPRKTEWVLEQCQEIKSRSLFDFRTLLTSIPRLINKSIKIVKLNLTVLYYSVVIRIQIFLPQKRKQQFPFKAKHGFSHPLTLNFSTNNKKSNRKTQAKYPLVIN